jgi:hypothetical protein
MTARARLIDAGGQLVLTAHGNEERGVFRGEINLDSMSASLRPLFEEYEDVVNTGAFGLLDEIEQKIDALDLTVLFDDNSKAKISDLQIFPKTKKISFNLQSIDQIDIGMNLTSDLVHQIQEAICRPEGTVSFKYTSKQLFDPAAGAGILIQIPSREHLFRIERDADLVLHFIHSSPGTGTRIASIDLKNVPPCETAFLAFTWSPTEINFHLKPTAIDAWKETIKAAEILATGKSDQGYIFETAVTNLTLTVLVTGFEAFAKKRFLEIEQEGIVPDVEAVVNSFFPRKEREAGIGAILKAEAEDAKRTVLQLIVERDNINFQNYQKCKLAYNKAYGIKFGELGLRSSITEKINKFILYRHRIIHVSALLGMLNQPEVPPDEPVFPKKELAAEAINTFDDFIQKLHGATLLLRKQD